MKSSPQPNRGDGRNESRSPRKRQSPGRPVILVAIAGGSGSGKSWLARALCRRLRPEAGLISLDDFYADLSHLPPAVRAKSNFDAPAAIDWAAFATTLRAIARGEAPVLPCYDFSRHTRAPRQRRWRRRRIVLVEGLWPWVKPQLRSLFALRIFRAAEPPLRLARRMKRDVEHRGRTPADVTRQWRTQVEPMYARYVAPQQGTADVVVGARLSPADLDALAEWIRSVAPKPAPVSAGGRKPGRAAPG